jgi:dTDP-4-dehydrorhamnose 3,5-epimerase-like enzyme
MENYKLENVKEPFLIKVQSISDDRGLLIPFSDEIDHLLFHRCYVVEDYGKGVIRGLHYHYQEFKIFHICSGAAKFITFWLPEDVAHRNDPDEIAVFARQNPDKIKSFVMSSRHHGVLLVPPKFANGWVSLEDKTILVSLGNLRWNEAKHDDIRIDPMIIGEKTWTVIGR